VKVWIRDTLVLTIVFIALVTLVAVVAVVAYAAGKQAAGETMQELTAEVDVLKEQMAGLQSEQGQINQELANLKE
jgi:cell division protein FtsB